MTKKQKEYLSVIPFGFFWIAFGWVVSLDPKAGEARLAEIAKWPAHPATVLRSEAGYSRPRPTTWTYPRIIYRYEVDGVIRTNETRSPGFYVIGSGSHTENVLRRFPPRSQAQARVNPANPWEAELEGAGAGPMYKRGRLVANILIGIGVFLIVGAIWEIMKLRA